MTSWVPGTQFGEAALVREGYPRKAFPGRLVVGRGNRTSAPELDELPVPGGLHVVQAAAASTEIPLELRIPYAEDDF